MTFTLDPESAREFAKLVAEEMAPLLRPAAEADPLLTCREAALQINMSHETVRQLVNGGHIQRAKGIKQIRIRQSALHQYGKSK